MNHDLMRRMASALSCLLESVPATVVVDADTQLAADLVSAQDVLNEYDAERKG